MGDNLLVAAQNFVVEFDAGTGWQTAYWNAGNIMYGAGCDQICRDLAALDPAAAGNPALKVRFHAEGSAGAIFVDDISVSGPERCDATGLLQSGAVTPAANDYTVNVGSPGGTPYLVMLECDWGGLSPAVTASDSFRFRLP